MNVFLPTFQTTEEAKKKEREEKEEQESVLPYDLCSQFTFFFN